MKRLIFTALCLGVAACIFGGCFAAENNNAGNAVPAANVQKKVQTVKININANGTVLTAELEDNATSRALLQKMPLNLPMLNLYGREMCYRFNEALPAGQLRSDNYEVGDIAYWPPRHSFVILYKQNGECFERQHLGRIINGDLSVFESGGEMQVSFSKAE